MVALSDLLASFRLLPLFRQAVLLGCVFFLIFDLYAYLVLGLSPAEALKAAMASAALFMAVFYFTSVIILKISAGKGETSGPRKGLRGK
jgi:hypothetical protein